MGETYYTHVDEILAVLEGHPGVSCDDINLAKLLLCMMEHILGVEGFQSYFKGFAFLTPEYLLRALTYESMVDILIDDAPIANEINRMILKRTMVNARLRTSLKGEVEDDDIRNLISNLDTVHF